jgi:hypothetical protein
LVTYIDNKVSPHGIFADIDWYGLEDMNRIILSRGTVTIQMKMFEAKEAARKASLTVWNYSWDE